MTDVNGFTSSGAVTSPFYLPEHLRQEMLAHVLSCLPEEACGLVGCAQDNEPEPSRTPGEANAPRPLAAAVILPIENELHSPERFRMAPAEQLKAFYWLEEHGLELSAIYHSHPRGPDHPSETDLAEFAYPGVLMLIVSPLDPLAASARAETTAAAGWQVRAYRLDGGFSSRVTAFKASEVPLLRSQSPRSQSLRPHRGEG